VTVLSLHPWVGLAAGVAGLAFGIAGTNFALSVPAEGKLPPLSISFSVAGHRIGHLVCGGGIAGIVTAMVGLVLGRSIAAPALVVCSVVGVALAIVDLRCRRLPYAMTSVLYLSAGLAFAAAAVADRDAIPIFRAAASSAAALAALLVLALALPGQLGLGDVFLFGWVVFSLAWFGWHPVVVGVLAGLIGQAVAAAALRIRHGPGYKLPMGPALLLGWFVGVAAAAVNLGFVLGVVLELTLGIDQGSVGGRSRRWRR
jgi:leader peptidase (prepilin peptidase)/N-methyltransferase